MSVLPDITTPDIYTPADRATWDFRMPFKSLPFVLLDPLRGFLCRHCGDTLAVYKTLEGPAAVERFDRGTQHSCLGALVSLTQVRAK